MNIRPHYASAVATVRESASARQVADSMVHHAVGCVVIVDEEKRPIGIVTDRDLCTRVVARGLGGDATLAGEIASKPVHVAQVEEPLETVAARMRQAGVRRVPVVDGEKLVGIVALDDLVVALGRELDSLGSTAKLEVREGLREGRRARRRADIEETLASLEASALSAGREALDFVSHEFDALRERLQQLRAKRSAGDSDEEAM